VSTGVVKSVCWRVPGVRLRPSDTTVATSVVRSGPTLVRPSAVTVTDAHVTCTPLLLGLAVPGAAVPGLAGPGDAVPGEAVAGEGEPVADGLDEVALSVGDGVPVASGSALPVPEQAAKARAARAAGTSPARRRTAVRPSARPRVMRAL
jgi:hypothetical protein